VLIRADAIGVNFVDTYFRSGMYPHQLPFILGGLRIAGGLSLIGAVVAEIAAGSAGAGGTGTLPASPPG